MGSIVVSVCPEAKYGPRCTLYKILESISFQSCCSESTSYLRDAAVRCGRPDLADVSTMMATCNRESSVYYHSSRVKSHLRRRMTTGPQALRGASLGGHALQTCRDLAWKWRWWWWVVW